MNRPVMIRDFVKFILLNVGYLMQLLSLKVLKDEYEK